MNHRAPALGLLAAWSWLALPAVSQALELGLTAQAAAEYSDNINRSEDDPLDSWLYRPGFNFTANQAGSLLQLNANYDYERRIYEQDIFDDENAITGRGQLRWTAIPNRLDFTLSNTRTEAARRAVAVTTEANRQEFGVTEAGPTLRLQPRSGDELQLEYRYTLTDVEETDTDSERQTLRLNYVLGVSAAQSFRLSASATQIEYDNDLIPDSDLWNGSLSTSRELAALSYNIEGGYSVFERDGQDDVDGFTFTIDLSRPIGAESQIFLRGNRSIDDRSANLTNVNFNRFNNVLSENSDLNDVITQERAELGIDTRLGRNSLSVALFADNQSFETAPRDNESAGVNVRLSRDLTRNTSVNLNGTFSNREFGDEGEDIDEIRSSLNVRHELGRRLSLSWGARYEERDANSDSRTFEEWVGFVTLDVIVIRPRN